MIGWLIFAAYVVLGIGTARTVFGHLYPDAADNLQRNMPYTYSSRADAERNAHKDGALWFATILCGLFWPVVAVFGGVVFPVGRVVGPLLVRWWMAPAKRRVKRKAGLS